MFFLSSEDGSWSRRLSAVSAQPCYMFSETNSFTSRVKLEENCELQGRDYVQGKISEHIFKARWGLFFYYPSNTYHKTQTFEYHSEGILSMKWQNDRMSHQLA